MTEREGVSEHLQRFESPPVGDDGIARALAAGQPALICETPDIFGTRRAGRPLEVTGWAWSGEGIAEVLVRIDGNVEIRALHDLVRPDLRKLYGGELGGAGFAVRLDPEEWTPGWHELTVVAVTRDGRAVGVSGQVECVDEQPPRSSPPGVIDPLPDEGHWLGSDFVPELHRELSVAPEHHARYRWAAPLVAGGRVLDAGCGTGWGTALLVEHAREVVGVDASPQAVAEAERRYGAVAKFRVGDLLQLPFRDDELDAVVCFEAIERVADPRRALTELARVLRPGGLLLVSCANRGVYPAGNPLHLSELSSHELEEALRAHFANVAVHRQQTYVASLLGDDAALAAGDPSAPLDAAAAKLVGGPPGTELYAVAAASDGDLPAAPAQLVLGTAVDHDEQRRLTEQWHQRSVYAEIEAAAIRTDAHFARLAHQEALELAAAREEDLTRRLTALERSASWRLTAPLRRLRRLVR